MWKLPLGGTEGMHTDAPGEPLEELYLVVDRRATFRIDRETFELGPGDAALAPVGSEHDAYDTGQTELPLVVVWANHGRQTGLGSEPQESPEMRWDAE